MINAAEIYIFTLFFFPLSCLLIGEEDVPCCSVSPPGVCVGGGDLCGDKPSTEVNTGEAFFNLCTCWK